MVLETVLPPHGMPLRAAMMDVNMMVLLHGQERTEEEYRELLANAGFTLTRVAEISDHAEAIAAIEAVPS